MYSVNEIITNCDKTIQIISNSFISDIVKHRSDIDNTFEVLSDINSKYVYGQEITFCILKNFLISDIASTFSGFMSNKEFKQYMQQASNIYPEISCPDTQNANNILNYCKATTFILEQYRYNNDVKIENGDICLDIGACLGDTSIYMIKNGASKVYAFDIDKVNIEHMKRTFSKLKMDLCVEIVDKATSNKNGIITYTPNQNNIGGGSIYKTKSNESYDVDTITIDDFCNENNIYPNFIKMDIEGAELDSILGAQKILNKCRPKLAISIYHRWSHRWEIPLTLKKLLPDYKFYIKKSHPTYETILFGKP